MLELSLAECSQRVAHAGQLRVAEACIMPVVMISEALTIEAMYVLCLKISCTWHSSSTSRVHEAASHNDAHLCDAFAGPQDGYSF